MKQILKLGLSVIIHTLIVVNCCGQLTSQSVAAEKETLRTLVQQAESIFVGRVEGVGKNGGTSYYLTQVCEILRDKDGLGQFGSVTNSKITILIFYPISTESSVLKLERQLIGGKFIIFMEKFPGKGKIWYVFGRDPRKGLVESTPHLLDTIKMLIGSNHVESFIIPP